MTPGSRLVTVVGEKRLPLCWRATASSRPAATSGTAAAHPERRRMPKPTILTVDDDPMVSAAITRDLRPATAPTTGSSAPRPARRRSTCWPELALRDEPGRADRGRPADAADDRHRDARAGPHARARREAPAAHGLRRHRRRDHRDQRHRPRLLPAQAVGPARGAALPGRRRPARRLAAGAPRADLRRARRRAPLVRAQPRDQDVPRPQPRALPLVRRRARRRGAAGCSELAGGDAGRPAARARARRRDPALAVDARASPARSACARPPSSRSTTSASSAAARPGWPPRSTPRRRG